jgi:hypothetical protein
MVWPILAATSLGSRSQESNRLLLIEGNDGGLKRAPAIIHPRLPQDRDIDTGPDNFREDADELVIGG